MTLWDSSRTLCRELNSKLQLPYRLGPPRPLDSPSSMGSPLTATRRSWSLFSASPWPQRLVRLPSPSRRGRTCACTPSGLQKTYPSQQMLLRRKFQTAFLYYLARPKSLDPLSSLLKKILKLCGKPRCNSLNLTVRRQAYLTRTS